MAYVLYWNDAFTYIQSPQKKKRKKKKKLNTDTNTQYTAWVDEWTLPPHDTTAPWTLCSAHIIELYQLQRLFSVIQMWLIMYISSEQAQQEQSIYISRHYPRIFLNRMQENESDHQKPPVWLFGKPAKIHVSWAFLPNHNSKIWKQWHLDYDTVWQDRLCAHLHEHKSHTDTYPVFLVS